MIQNHTVVSARKERTATSFGLGNVQALCHKNEVVVGFVLEFLFLFSQEKEKSRSPQTNPNTTIQKYKHLKTNKKFIKQIMKIITLLSSALGHPESRNLKIVMLPYNFTTRKGALGRARNERTATSFGLGNAQALCVQNEVVVGYCT